VSRALRCVIRIAPVETQFSRNVVCWSELQVAGFNTQLNSLSTKCFSIPSVLLHWIYTYS